MEEDAGGSSSLPPEEGYLLVRIHVPELNVQKCLQFPRDQLVWDVKQQCLAALPKVTVAETRTSWPVEAIECHLSRANFTAAVVCRFVSHIAGVTPLSLHTGFKPRMRRV